ncbi:sialate O-acetylesterase [Methylorubrum sp. SB2]|uniref:sialate O-acetylesterase n=1 Tax=Methylorubrum subtropicum TaxID=3138812 RepID=UPI00313B6EAD
MSLGIGIGVSVVLQSAQSSTAAWAAEYAATGLAPGMSFQRASTASYTTSTRQRATAANNTPRFDYNPYTGQARGLLLEKAGTNYLRNSTMVGAVSGSPGTFPTNWGNNSSGSYTRTQTVGAIGEMKTHTVRWVKAAGTQAGFGFYLDTNTGIPAVAGDVVEFTFPARLTGGSLDNIASIQVILAIRDAAGNSSGNALQGPAYLSEVINDDFVMLTTGPITVVDGTGTTAFVRPLFQALDTTGAVDITLTFAEPMVERNEVSTRTSFIPTSGTTATRATDVVRYNNLSNLNYEAGQGYLLVEFEPLARPTVARVAKFDDGTSANTIGVGFRPDGTSSGYVTNGGTFTAALTSGEVTMGTTNRAVIAWDANGLIRMCCNGATVAKATGVTVPNFSGMRIGEDFYGTISRVEYGKVNLTDNQMREKTRAGSVVDVLIIAGQSNADGFPLKTTFPAAAFPLWQRMQTAIYMYNKPTKYAAGGAFNFDAASYVDDGAWWKMGTLYNPATMISSMTIGNTPGQGQEVESVRRLGMEAYLGQLYAAANPGKELRIIKIACHSSSLANDWRPQTQAAGYLWNYFKDYVYGPAIADIVAQGRVPNVIGMVWAQGEGDATGAYSAAYQTNLQSLIDRINALPYTPRRIVIGRIAAYYATISSGQTVRAAQQTVSTANSPQTVMVDTDAFEVSPGTGGVNIHYTGLGLQSYANAAWSIINS